MMARPMARPPWPAGPILAAGVALLASADALAAAADRGAPRSLAVVEMRSGSAQLPDLGERLGALARKATHLQVTAPSEARRSAGLDVDAAVARCDGDVVCLAGLGQRLGVRSLLVAAVSQLGDVIVALQLVDVEARRVAGRYAALLPPGGTVADDELLRWLEHVLPPEAFVRYGTLAVRTDVAGAHVAIDGKPLGDSPLAAPLELEAPHLYRLTITKDGHLPFGAAVDVQPGQKVEVLATLPAQSVPVWRRPWFWALAVGGLAAGAAVGIRLSTHDATTVDGNATVVRGGQ